LPRWLPSGIRHLIAKRDVSTIRLVSSFLFSYKGLTVPNAVADLSTITRPAPEVDKEILAEFSKFSRRFWVWLWENHRSAFPAWYSYRKFTSVFNWSWDIFGVSSAGPNSSVGASEMGKILVLIAQPFLEGSLPPFTAFSKAWGIKFPTWPTILQTVDAHVTVEQAREFKWGRLSAKLEAAGKVRVFAIVDNLTQVCLRPLHDFLINGLKAFSSCDATHDQSGVTEAFAQKVKQGNLPTYSFDLRAATDLIPRIIYELLFVPLLGVGRTRTWLGLMVDRDYFVGDATRPRTKEGFDPSSPEFVRYGTGQPMGALSSWASLA